MTLFFEMEEFFYYLTARIFFFMLWQTTTPYIYVTYYCNVENVTFPTKNYSAHLRKSQCPLAVQINFNVMQVFSLLSRSFFAVCDRIWMEVFELSYILQDRQKRHPFNGLFFYDNLGKLAPESLNQSGF